MNWLDEKAVELQKVVQSFDRQVKQLQEDLIEVRLIPISQVFDRPIRAARKISKELESHFLTFSFQVKKPGWTRSGY